MGMSVYANHHLLNVLFSLILCDWEKHRAKLLVELMQMKDEFCVGTCDSIDAKIVLPVCSAVPYNYI